MSRTAVGGWGTRYYILSTGLRLDRILPSPFGLLSLVGVAFLFEGASVVLAMEFLNVRNTTYSIILVLSVGEALFGTFCCLFGGFRSLIFEFGLTAAITSLFTLAWISVLLGFNNCPGSKRHFCQARFHFASFLVFSVVWLIESIMMTSQTPKECVDIDDSWWKDRPCGMTAAATASAWIIFVVSLGNTFLIYHGSQTFGLGANISQTPESHIGLDLPS